MFVILGGYIYNLLSIDSSFHIFLPPSSSWQLQMDLPMPRNLILPPRRKGRFMVSSPVSNRPLAKHLGQSWRPRPSTYTLPNSKAREVTTIRSPTRIVKLWKKCGRYMEEVQKSAPKTTPTPDSSRLLAAPPRTAEENEEFTRALEEGPFRGELDQLSRAGGHCRPDSPHRTQSTRSDPFHGVPSKRKMDLTPALSSLRPLKRQK